MCAKVVIVSNTFDSLVIFRGPLIRRLLALGHQVTAIAPINPLFGVNYCDTLHSWGVETKAIKISPLSFNPIRDLPGIVRLALLLNRIKPDVLFSYTIKPNIYCGLLHRTILSGTRFVALVNGLGSVFLKRGARAEALAYIAKKLYRIAFGRADAVFFHNNDDRDYFVNNRLVDKSIVALVPGSGVDLNHFQFSPTPIIPIQFLFVGRILREKGIGEFLAASEVVSKEFPDAQFSIAGGEYEGASGEFVSRLKNWVSSNKREYLGAVSDMKTVLSKASVVVLPSYREGLSRALLEGLSVGRPLITTNTPGCRELVRNGTNGYLVDVGNTAELADAMRSCIRKPEKLAEMGAQSRKLAESEYAEEQMVEKVIGILGFR